MPAPRLSQSAEAARAAALQAEFNEKKWVWVPDEKEGYLAGWVHKEDGNVGEIVMASGGEVCLLCTFHATALTYPKFADPASVSRYIVQNEPTQVRSRRRYRRFDLPERSQRRSQSSTEVRLRCNICECTISFRRTVLART